MMEDYTNKHEDSSNSASFLPKHLRDMRKYLLIQNSGNLNELMNWTIIILGCRLFLRVDEVLSLQIESFVPQYFAVKEKKVLSLCVKITRKTGDDESEDQHFQVHDDPYYPEFSPVRPLLLFIAASKRMQGYIFPVKEQMFEANATKAYHCNDFLNTLHYLVKDVLGMDLSSGSGRHHLYAGTHILRKTALLLAYWGTKMGKINHSEMNIHHGGIPIEDLAAIYNDPRNDSMLCDGRREISTSIAADLGDAATLFALYSRLGNRDPDQMVGPYMPISMCIANASDDSHPINNKTLPELAAWFVFDIMEVDKDTVLKANIPLLCSMAHSLDHADNAVNITPTNILEELRAHLPPDLFSQVAGHLSSSNM
ncbi:unnamed protein product [Cylindrotheca closterium]|uniref:Uncharacterized protein n=1 Tax=Cylindrotheca closterium TaxID=2856 RepID=A0AAD2JGQ5_9STRA|nr:unnamed protein product [Cylindrotheca closterium]